MTKSEPILSGTNPPRRRSLTLAAKQNSLYDFFFARATDFFF